MTTPATTYLYSDYDPAKYYTNYDPSSDFYLQTDIYKDIPVLDSLGYPIPNAFNFDNINYLQYWSAIFDFPLIKAGLLFSVFATVIGALACIIFVFNWMKNDGFAGFDWNSDPHNIDAYEPMQW